jgi:hypothetical protein
MNYYAYSDRSFILSHIEALMNKRKGQECTYDIFDLIAPLSLADVEKHLAELKPHVDEVPLDIVVDRIKSMHVPLDGACYWAYKKGHVSLTEAFKKYKALGIDVNILAQNPYFYKIWNSERLFGIYESDFREVYTEIVKSGASRRSIKIGLLKAGETYKKDARRSRL